MVGCSSTSSKTANSKVETQKQVTKGVAKATVKDFALPLLPRSIQQRGKQKGTKYIVFASMALLDG
eukprot:4816445-Amphidinium_carterae.1